MTVAANFTVSAKELQRRFSRVRGEALLSFSGSGQRCRQVTQRAPFELFLGPTRPPEQSGSERSCVPESRSTYATYNLVLYRSFGAFALWRSR
ncbi:hypothetical protein I6F35_37605 [Bradyrhizobium sp. BRP22]|uniref:hypothetical protein n=1 Tax=Bradyrhizobium sp. BRP22 TaxID=2793821 RepID=UPI001CD54533|nr:hypothetical protein [Bradyrhizobium sp. BRP22]MCA1458809.1 hypothetical protein [Bradyrhizobium sp. BRP22]